MSKLSYSVQSKQYASRGARRTAWNTYAVVARDAEGWVVSSGFEHRTYEAAKAELARKIERDFQEYFWNLNAADQGFPVDEDTARAMFARR